MSELTSLAEYGMAGIAIALIIALGYVIKTFTDALKNHIQHNTDALTGLKTAITELVTWLKAKNGRGDN